MSKPKVLWKPNSAVQRAFLACSARTAMIGGGAGGGKTSALLAAAAAQTTNSRHRAIIFRKDYPSLKHIISASYALFLPVGARYNKAEHCWTFRSGSTLEFAHLEDETAMYQHAGKEYSYLAFDELQQLPGDAIDSRGQPINSAFSFMQSRLRAPADAGLKRLEIRCTATPFGPGVQWCKSYFRIPDSGESTEFVDPVTGFRRAYFKSTVEDNPALSGTDYHKQLADLPAAQRKALLHGDWSAVIGQVFSEYDYNQHTCEPIEQVPEAWRLWRSADDGYAQPCAVLWFAHDEVHDRIFVVDELYERGLGPRELARAVLKIDSKFERDEPLDGVIDSAAFAEIGLGAEYGKGSRGHIMNSLGCRWKAAEKGPGSRVHGISVIHDRLKLRTDGHPGLVIGRNCRNLIRTLPALVYSRTNPEDIDDSCEQHAVDCLRYGLTRKKVFFARVRVRGL
jgi:hypothetical protein